MNVIGGFFEEENLNDNKNGFPFLEDQTYSNGRSALYEILQICQPTKIFLPAYTCDAVLEPILKLQIPYSLVEINNQMEFVALPDLKSSEVLLGINYFGLKGTYLKEISTQLGTNLIIDNSQAFYSSNWNTWAFNSLRKYFGVPDGSILYTPDGSTLKRTHTYNLPKTEHLKLRKNGAIDLGYKLYKESEEEQAISDKKMSNYSSEVLQHLNLKSIRQRRIENFNYLVNALSKRNQLDLSINIKHDVPLCYPFWPKNPIPHAKFWNHGIYVPVFWKECLKRGEKYKFESVLSAELIPLPVDHRYGKEEMKRMIEFILMQ